MKGVCRCVGIYQRRGENPKKGRKGGLIKGGIDKALIYAKQDPVT